MWKLWLTFRPHGHTGCTNASACAGRSGMRPDSAGNSARAHVPQAGPRPPRRDGQDRRAGGRPQPCPGEFTSRTRRLRAATSGALTTGSHRLPHDVLKAGPPAHEAPREGGLGAQTWTYAMTLTKTLHLNSSSNKTDNSADHTLLGA